MNDIMSNVGNMMKTMMDNDVCKYCLYLNYYYFMIVFSISIAFTIFIYQISYFKNYVMSHKNTQFINNSLLKFLNTNSQAAFLSSVNKYVNN